MWFAVEVFTAEVTEIREHELAHCRNIQILVLKRAVLMSRRSSSLEVMRARSCVFLPSLSSQKNFVRSHHSGVSKGRNALFIYLFFNF